MEANVRPPVSHAGKGVTDTVLAVDLEKEPANIKERQLRFRKWEHFVTLTCSTPISTTPQAT
jgi:hypothetical protein